MNRNPGRRDRQLHPAKHIFNLCDKKMLVSRFEEPGRELITVGMKIDESIWLVSVDHPHYD
ncbi:hypothetical protein AAFN85_18625 [Mucilaginibacter sp. CAU 1740]|uniref:hypothetical protein n=1 Tax=Mucilaginibacter sp. CAU 1740 TaxID=3140365 RepID=UPI00325B4680